MPIISTRANKKLGTMSGYHQPQPQQRQQPPHRSPTVSFLSPPPRSSFHDEQHQHQQHQAVDDTGDIGDIGAAPGSAGLGLSLSGSGRRISSLAMLNSAGSAGSGTSYRSGGGAGGTSGSGAARTSASIASATSAFAPTPRKLLDTGTPGSAGSHGTVLRSASAGGGHGGSSSSTGRPGTGRSTASALGLTSIGGTAHNPSSAHSAITAHSQLQHAQAATPTSMMLVPPSQTIAASLQQLASSTALHLEAVWDEVGYSPDERAAQLSDLLAKFRQVCDDKVAEERGVAQTFRKEIDAAREEIVHLSRALRVDIDPELWDAVQSARRREGGQDQDQDQENKTRKNLNTGNDSDNNHDQDSDLRASRIDNDHGNEDISSTMDTPNSPYYRPSTAANLNAVSTTLTDELAALEVTLDDLRSSAATATDDLTECRTRLQSAHAALATDLEDEWKDVTTDLTNDRRRAFRQRVAEMDQEVQLRTQTIVGLLKDCQHLIRELRVEADGSSGQFGPIDRSGLDRQIMGSLARDPVSDDIVMTSTEESSDCTGIGSRALEELTERVAELNGEKRRRKARLGEMGAEIATLWEKLHVLEEEQRTFAKSVKGLGMDTIRKGEVELGRLLELKAAMMGRLIDEARDEIERLWEDTSATVSQRSAFRAFSIADENRYSDELLAEHDAYIQHLQRRYEQMQPILKVITKREDIIRERMEYEELQKDPTRLQQRGSALTKQLMKEEKIARRIKKDLPKATDYLERKLREWRKTHDEPFLYDGEVYLDVMHRQQEEWKSYKENEMALKLAKRQEQKKNPSDPSYNAKLLPGKKKIGGGGGGGLGGSAFGNQPLTDAGNRNNREHASRAKSRGRAPHGSDTFDFSKPSTGRAAPRSRPVSRGRMGLGWQ